MTDTQTQILETLARAWRDGHETTFGEQGLEDANEALAHAQLARVLAESFVLNVYGEVTPLHTGTHVLVWRRGKRLGEDVYVGWYATMDVLNLFPATASVLEIIQ